VDYGTPTTVTFKNGLFRVCGYYFGWGFDVFFGESNDIARADNIEQLLLGKVLLPNQFGKIKFRVALCQ